MNKQEILNKITEKGYQDALNLQDKAIKKEINETEIIDQEICIPLFDNTKDYRNWQINSPVVDENQVWLLLQPYNAIEHPERPSELRSMWGLAHTTNAKKAKPYIAPFGISGLYQKNECCIIDKIIYRSKVDNNAYSPKEYLDNWEILS